MQFKSLFLALATLYAMVAASMVTVSYDHTYDNASRNLSMTACSDGPHGLESKFPTFGSLRHFPNIGGAVAIAFWDSPSCGSCWRLTYENRSINVLAVDHAADGFNIAFAAMNKLTNGQARSLGRVNATAKEVSASACGL
ncbi:Cerato-platanin [Epithele typhae]|uniref:Cerato-platanin n=1 Tax=Epithele typhae TaxID=378194 RepID=UPI0020077E81|nr:Cerato-platanin [Epithele typhae]KAH9921542.1 Cerato-platanin [Epithele typhae]